MRRTCDERAMRQGRDQIACPDCVDDRIDGDGRSDVDTALFKLSRERVTARGQSALKCEHLNRGREKALGDGS